MITLRIAVLSLTVSVATHGALGESHHLSPEKAEVLHSVQQHVLAYTSNLPNFICTQTTKRDTSKASTIISPTHGILGPDYGPSDTIVEKVTFSGLKEHYQVLTINGRKAEDVQHEQVAGATSGGEFGSALRVIFDPRTHTEFSWHRMSNLHGVRVYVIGFRVPKAAGMPILDRNVHKLVVVPYRGVIDVDPKTLDVLRFTTHFDLPHNFQIQRADRTVDYDYVTIAGKRFNLPSHVDLIMEVGALTFTNKIDFTEYHEFTVQSTIRYGALNNLPPPSPPPSAQHTPEQSSPPAQPLENPATPPAVPATTQPQPASQPIAANKPPTPQSTASASPAIAAANPSPLPPALPAPASQPAPAVEAAPLPHPGTSAPPSANMPPDAPAFRLQLNTNLVLVPVVVRDASGHAVTDLTRDDFEVYDKGKRQKISDFTVEMQEGLTSRTPSNVPNQASPKSPVAPLPVNFVVYLFDDLHLQTDDLVRARNAVLRQLDTMPANNRVAVLATSGLVEQSFTPDRQKLRNALLRLRAEPLGDVSQGRCPHIGYYIARRFLMGNDNLLRKALIAETLACLSLPPPSDGPGFHDTERIASNQLMQTARSVVQTGEQQSREALLELRDIIHAMAKAPGQRTVILISRGFLLGDTAQFEASDVLDDAIRNQVVISTLDARGLYVLNPAGDIEEKGYVPELIAVTHLLKADEAIAITGVMQEMAEGTGGTFIRNTNDLDVGLQRLTLPPGCTYVLAFKPTHIKLNGSYHPLTVKVKTRERTTVQARRGYYATQRR